jgi:hypothetical protein
MSYRELSPFVSLQRDAFPSAVALAYLPKFHGETSTANAPIIGLMSETPQRLTLLQYNVQKSYNVMNLLF